MVFRLLWDPDGQGQLLTQLLRQLVKIFLDLDLMVLGYSFLQVMVRGDLDFILIHPMRVQLRVITLETTVRVLV
ncbi:hypothetical protein FLSA109164_01230 [Flavobacterium saliperosum]